VKCRWHHHFELQAAEITSAYLHLMHRERELHDVLRVPMDRGYWRWIAPRNNEAHREHAEKLAVNLTIRLGPA
jgi:hypothetical protein